MNDYEKGYEACLDEVLGTLAFIGFVAFIGACLRWLV